MQHSIEALKASVDGMEDIIQETLGIKDSLLSAQVLRDGIRELQTLRVQMMDISLKSAETTGIGGYPQEENLMYQTRKYGAIRHFDTITEASRTCDEDLDKLSFNTEDGSRIRLVHQGNGLFTVTYWDDHDPSQRQYRVLGNTPNSTR